MRRLAVLTITGALVLMACGCRNSAPLGKDVVVLWATAVVEGDDSAANRLTYEGITRAELDVERSLLVESRVPTSVVSVQVRKIGDDLYTIEEIKLEDSAIRVYERGDPYDVVVPLGRSQVWARLGKDGENTKTFSETNHEVTQ